MGLWALVRVGGSFPGGAGRVEVVTQVGSLSRLEPGAPRMSFASAGRYEAKESSWSCDGIFPAVAKDAFSVRVWPL